MGSRIMRVHRSHAAPSYRTQEPKCGTPPAIKRVGDTAKGRAATAAEGGGGSPGGGRETCAGSAQDGALPVPFRVCPISHDWPRHSSGGVETGCFRHFVACSYPYASLISLDSSKARPNICSPAGNALFRVYPIGTVIAGIPVSGE